jgi:hypothetical protein
LNVLIQKWLIRNPPCGEPRVGHARRSRTKGPFSFPVCVGRFFYHASRLLGSSCNLFSGWERSCNCVVIHSGLPGHDEALGDILGPCSTIHETVLLSRAQPACRNERFHLGLALFVAHSMVNWIKHYEGNWFLY